MLKKPIESDDEMKEQSGKKILSRENLKMFLEKDKLALGKVSRKPSFFGDEIWKFEIVLRKHEYYLNTHSNKLLEKLYQFLHHNMGIKLGFEIPCNVFGPGLRINHSGYIVVNPKACVGSFCDIHQGVNIGESIDGLAPTLGDNIWIGPGAKLFGGITLGSNIMIGANAVVNRSYSNGVNIAGVPAKVINHKGNYYYKRGEKELKEKENSIE